MLFFFQLRGTDLGEIPLLDSATYHDWAVRLVAGDWGWNETYWMGPLYPHFLALVYLVFGVGSQAAIIIQLALSLLNVGLIYRFTRVLLPADKGGTALLGTALFAFYGAPVFYAGNLLMATLVTTLYLLTGLQAVRAANQPSVRHWFGLGLMTGLTGLARGNVLVLLAVFPILLWTTPTFGALRWKNLAALVLGGMLMLAPATVRNLVVADDFVLLTSNGGVNLLIGQQHDYQGIFAPVMETAQAEFDPSMETPSNGNWVVISRGRKSRASSPGRPGTSSATTWAPCPCTMSARPTGSGTDTNCPRSSVTTIGKRSFQHCGYCRSRS